MRRFAEQHAEAPCAAFGVKRCGVIVQCEKIGSVLNSQANQPRRGQKPFAGISSSRPFTAWSDLSALVLESSFQARKATSPGPVVVVADRLNRLPPVTVLT